MDTLFSGVGSIVPFILLIGVVVTIHELGHYYAGRLFGAAVESFAFGFGDPIFERKDKRGTRWRINWAPLGGFVKFADELQTPGDFKEEGEGRSDAGLVGKPYSALEAWQRVIVSLAGPMANFIFAICVYAVFSMTIGEPVYERVAIQFVEKQSSGHEAGLLPGDQILSIEGRTIENPTDVLLAVQYSADEPLDFTLQRDGAVMSLVVTPRRFMRKDETLNIEEEIGRIGVGFERPTGFARLNPLASITSGFNQVIDLVRVTIKVLGRLVTGKDDFSKMRGPLGIGDFADKLVDSHMKQVELPLGTRIKRSALALVSMAALFSVSIGFFNLLPIPLLDGYHVLLGLYETVVGSAVSLTIQKYLMRGGLAAIGFFFIAVTWNDIKRTGVLEVFAGLLS